MYNKRTISIANKVVTSYTVSADEMHMFITDTVKRCGGCKYYQSDLLLDYESMLHNMADKVWYMWSIRETGTWFMPVTAYAKCQPDMLNTPLIRFIVTKHDTTYKFVEYVELNLNELL